MPSAFLGHSQVPGLRYGSPKGPDRITSELVESAMGVMLRGSPRSRRAEGHFHGAVTPMMPRWNVCLSYSLPWPSPSRMKGMMETNNGWNQRGAPHSRLLQPHITTYVVLDSAWHYALYACAGQRSTTNLVLVNMCRPQQRVKISTQGELFSVVTLGSRPITTYREGSKASLIGAGAELPGCLGSSQVAVGKETSGTLVSESCRR